MCRSSSIALIALSLALPLALAATGCTTTKGYSGPTRPDDQLATVVAHGVTFESANGVRVGSFSSKVEVPAGKNEFELTINPANFNDPDRPRRNYKLIMQAEAGKTYAITGRRGDARLCAFPLTKSGDPDFSASAGCIVR